MYRVKGQTHFFLVFILFVSISGQLRNKIKQEDVDWVRDHDVADMSSYTCSEIVKWVRNEKHYSNDDVFRQLEALLVNGNCSNMQALEFMNIAYKKNGGKFIKSVNETVSCGIHVPNAVIFLSNFSINNNFSHFLHALLRLFCALVDARFIVWDRFTKQFVKPVAYSIWLDPNLKMDKAKLAWLAPLTYTKDLAGPHAVVHLKDLSRKDCVSSDKLIYGSGCVKLLPPEKWFGYGGCRALTVSYDEYSLMMTF
jgi:hypothetical protein